MAVLATANITVTYVKDVKSVTRYYYLLKAAIASYPSKPEDNTVTPASPWTTQEPAYDSTQTTYLYFTDRVEYSNGSIKYSDVCLSSSYEAAKTAYNKAVGAENAANIAKIPFIESTQTAATGSWTGVAPFDELVDGQEIVYWLRYAGSGNATLNLTLANGTTTGAKNCYYGGTSRLTTHYAAGNAIRLVYRKAAPINSSTYEGWWADANYNSDTTNVKSYSGRVILNEAVTTDYPLLVCGTDGKYRKLTAGLEIDISKPILCWYTTTDLSTSNYSTLLTTGISSATFRLEQHDIPLANTLSGWTGTNGKSVYLVGTLSGSKTFTLDSTTPCTTTEPTTDDGKYYLYLGLCTYSSNNTQTNRLWLSATHDLYKYFNGSLQKWDVTANYLKVQNGIIIADHTKSTLGTNVLIDDDSVDIRNGSTVLASYGTTATIGKTGTNDYNTHIDTTDISLRKGTKDLVNINTDGMSIKNTQNQTIAKYGIDEIVFFNNRAKIRSADNNLDPGIVISGEEVAYLIGGTPKAGDTSGLNTKGRFYVRGEDSVGHLGGYDGPTVYWASSTAMMETMARNVNQETGEFLGFSQGQIHLWSRADQTTVSTSISTWSDSINIRLNDGSYESPDTFGGHVRIHSDEADKDLILLEDANRSAVDGSVSTPHLDVNVPIIVPGESSSWVLGRDNARIKQTTLSGYSPMISVKADNTSWEMGTYSNSSYVDELIFTNVADSKYNINDNNGQNGRVRFKSNGRILTETPTGTEAEIVASSGNRAAQLYANSAGNVGVYATGTGSGHIVLRDVNGNVKVNNHVPTDVVYHWTTGASTSVTLASGGYSALTLSCSGIPTGYVIKGIAAYNISGTGCTWFNVYRMDFSGTNILISVKNLGTTQYTCTVKAWPLIVKSTGF